MCSNILGGGGSKNPFISVIFWPKTSRNVSFFCACLKHPHTHTCSWFMVAQALFNWLLGITEVLHTDAHLHSLSPDGGAALPPLYYPPALSVSLSLARWRGRWRSPGTSMGTNRQRNGWESVVNRAVWCNIRRWKDNLVFWSGQVENTSHGGRGLNVGLSFSWSTENLHNLLGLFSKPPPKPPSSGVHPVNIKTHTGQPSSTKKRNKRLQPALKNKIKKNSKKTLSSRIYGIISPPPLLHFNWS